MCVCFKALIFTGMYSGLYFVQHFLSVALMGLPTWHLHKFFIAQQCLTQHLALAPKDCIQYVFFCQMSNGCNTLVKWQIFDKIRLLWHFPGLTYIKSHDNPYYLVQQCSRWRIKWSRTCLSFLYRQSPAVIILPKNIMKKQQFLILL